MCGGRVARVAEVIIQRGSAAEIHGLDPFAQGRPDGPQVWLCRFDAPALVLGSRQRDDIVDVDACARLGLRVVRRRSGGGAVLLQPDDLVWIDLVVPSGAAPDDVRGSMVWAGDLWRDALAGLGAPRDRMSLHRGGVRDTAWSDLVCFAGLGPGEVLADDRKLVGLSQRRTRHGLRIQGQVHRRGIVAITGTLFRVATPSDPIEEAAVLGDVGLADVADTQLAAALASALVHRMTPV